MQAEYYNMLDSCSQKIIDEVESVINQDILALPAEPDIVRDFPFVMNYSVLDIYPDNPDRPNQFVTIWYPPTSQSIDAISLWHEVQHISLNLIQHTPRMYCRNSASQELREEVCKVDNDIDHAKFVGQEISMFPNREQYWSEEWLNNGLIPSTNSPTDAVYLSLINMFCNDSAKSMAMRIISAKRRRAETEKYSEELLDCISDKRNAIDWWLNAMPKTYRESLEIKEYHYSGSRIIPSVC